MKKVIHLFVAAAIFAGCSKDEDKGTPGSPTGVPIANFSFSGSGEHVPYNVQFTNSSQGATSYSWDFGDGNYSTANSPSNVYYSPGSYSVILTASSANGSGSATKNVNLQAAYTSVKITQIKITASPLSGYDGGSNADIMVEVGSIYSSTYYQDVSSFPVTWSTNILLSPLTSNFSLYVYDYDFPDPNDLMGAINIPVPSYCTAGNHYPAQVNLSSGGISVTLTLQWQ